MGADMTTKERNELIRETVEKAKAEAHKAVLQVQAFGGSTTIAVNAALDSLIPDEEPERKSSDGGWASQIQRALIDSGWICIHTKGDAGLGVVTSIVRRIRAQQMREDVDRFFESACLPSESCELGMTIYNEADRLEGTP